MKKYLNDLRSQKHFFGKIQIAEITNKRLIYLTTLKWKLRGQAPTPKTSVNLGEGICNICTSEMSSKLVLVRMRSWGNSSLPERVQTGIIWQIVTLLPWASICLPGTCLCARGDSYKHVHYVTVRTETIQMSIGKWKEKLWYKSIFEEIPYDSSNG